MSVFLSHIKVCDNIICSELHCATNFCYTLDLPKFFSNYVM